jgi:hypothetical protein
MNPRVKGWHDNCSYTGKLMKILEMSHMKPG